MNLLLKKLGYMTRADREEPPVSASELWHAHRWRIGFAILLCILAVACWIAVFLE